MIQESKVFKNASDFDYKVSVGLAVDTEIIWVVTVHRKEKGTRNWEALDCRDKHEYQQLDAKDRDKYYKSFLLTHIPAFWIREVKGMVMKLLMNKAAF